MQARYDLVIRGGRVIDPASGTDAILDVAFEDGKVAEVSETDQVRYAQQVIDARERLVVPGLVDLHTHIYWGGTSLGVDAESIATRSGTTSFVDAGSAGAGNFAGFKQFIAAASPLQICAFLNIAYAGICGFGPRQIFGECSDLRLLDGEECAKSLNENRDLLVGIKVRVGAETSGRNGTAPLAMAREVADRLGVPIMAHVDQPPPALAEVMALLRPGDIWTHCFRGPPNSLIQDDGTINAEILAAKKRGVIFDVGHGMGSLSFRAARGLIAANVYPDTISSDVHRYCVDGPARDVLHTAAKFLALGMPLQAVIDRITAAPATAAGLRHAGRLAPGQPGNAVILEDRVGAFPFYDSHGEEIIGERQLYATAVILDGTLWRDNAKTVG